MPTPCDADWRHQGPHTSHERPPSLCFDEDLEPVYATISEITDGMDEASVLPAGRQLFHDLVQVFADLAALPAVDTGDTSSIASSSASPPPALTDAPASRRTTVPQPIPGHIVNRLLYSDDQKHTVTSPPRFYTYC